jgi:hypothetical protein
MQLPLPSSIIHCIGIFASAEFILLTATYLYFFSTEQAIDSARLAVKDTPQSMLEDIEKFLSLDSFEPASTFGEHLKSEWNRTYGP